MRHAGLVGVQVAAAVLQARAAMQQQHHHRQIEPGRIHCLDHALHYAASSETESAPVKRQAFRLASPALEVGAACQSTALAVPPLLHWRLLCCCAHSQQELVHVLLAFYMSLALPLVWHGQLAPVMALRDGAGRREHNAPLRQQSERELLLFGEWEGWGLPPAVFGQLPPVIEEGPAVALPMMSE